MSHKNSLGLHAYNSDSEDVKYNENSGKTKEILNREAKSILNKHTKAMHGLDWLKAAFFLGEKQFAEKLCDSEDGVLLLKIVEALELLPINARKTVSYLFNYILRRNWGKPPLVSILGPAGQYSHLIQQFIKGYVPKISTSQYRS